MQYAAVNNIVIKMAEDCDPKRVSISEDDLSSLDRDELTKLWRKQDKFISALEQKHQLEVKELESKLQMALHEVSRKEDIMMMRLTAKEQEVQDYMGQINEMKAAGANSAVRTLLLDPAVNFVIEKLKRELSDTKAKLEETQSELSAWKFTPDSQTGKRLMAKCRLLHQENEDLGKVVASGKLAKLENELALQRNLADEMKKSQSEMDEFVQELDEDVEGMQSTILYLQQQLRQAKEAAPAPTQLGGAAAAPALSPDTNGLPASPAAAPAQPADAEVTSARSCPPQSSTDSVAQNGHADGDVQTSAAVAETVDSSEQQEPQARTMPAEELRRTELTDSAHTVEEADGESRTMPANSPPLAVATDDSPTTVQTDCAERTIRTDSTLPTKQTDGAARIAQQDSQDDIQRTMQMDDSGEGEAGAQTEGEAGAASADGAESATATNGTSRKRRRRPTEPEPARPKRRAAAAGEADEAPSPAAAQPQRRAKRTRSTDGNAAPASADD